MGTKTISPRLLIYVVLVAALMAVALALPARSQAASAPVYSQMTFFGAPEMHDRCAALKIHPAQSCPRFTGRYLTTTVWRWDAGAYRWRAVTMQPGQHVWTVFYAPGWMWLWTSRTGWVAADTDLLSAYDEPGVIGL